MEENREKPYVIGIAGGTGSGKSTFAAELMALLDTDEILHISHDSYYRDLSFLPFEERVKNNFDHPDSLENELLIDHLQKLSNWQAVDLPVYDFCTHCRKAEVEHMEPKPVILVEGILIFSLPELRELFDTRIFVDTDADIRFIRRLLRDIRDRGRSAESVSEQYLKTVRPMHEAFVEPSKRYADIVVPNGGKNKAALTMVATQIWARLSRI